MKRILLIAILLISRLAVIAQSHQTVDNHAGIWDLRSTWQNNWNGIYATTSFSEEVQIYGQVTRGSTVSAKNLTFTGTGAKLVVYDTLQIFDHLSLKNGAQLEVAAGGVLIIHGDYSQDVTSSAINNGTVVIHGSITIALGSSIVNNGSVYTEEASAYGSYTTKSHSDLEAENSQLYRFGMSNVISIYCAGSNSGKLMISGDIGEVYRWEKSNDRFESDIQPIANTTKQLTYSNLSETTYYRVYFRDTAKNADVYSFYAAVLIYDDPLIGTVVGASQVCNGSSTTYSLSGQHSDVVRWEWSTDNFAADIQTLVTNGETLTLTPTADTQVRAIFSNNNCSEARSASFSTLISTPPTAGTISGPATLCQGHPGNYTLSGYSGTIKRWEWSTDDFTSDVQPIVTSASNISLSPTSNIKVRAVVGSGACSETTTAPLAITVRANPIGGTLSGSTQACSGSTVTYTLSSYSGTITRWEWSTDNFATTINTVSNTTSTLVFTVNQTISVRAVLSNNPCTEVCSSVITTQADAQPVGGTLSGDTQVCTGTEVTYTLSGHSGTIVKWETSSDNFASDITAIANSSSSLSLTVNSDIAVRAVVGNGVCSEVYSTALTTQADVQPMGGTISGSSQTCEGSTVTYTLSGYSGSIIRWETSTDNFTSDITTIGSTSASITQTINATIFVRAIVGNGVCADVMSNTLTTSVDAAPAAGYISGTDQICEGTDVAYTLSGYSGTIIRWESSVDNFSGDVQLIGNNSSTLEVTPTQDIWVRAVIGNGSCAEVITPAFYTKVDAQPIAGSISGNNRVCAGSTNLYTLSAYSGNVQGWQASTDNFASDVRNISNSTSTLNFTVTQNIWLRAIINNGVCPPVYTPVIQIETDEAPQSGDITGPGLVCEGADLAYTLTNYKGSIIRWETSSDGFGSDIQPIANTTSVLSFTASATISVRAIVGNGVCPEVASTAITTQVDARPIAGSISGAPVICAGNSNTLTLNSYSGTVIRWESSADNFASEINSIASTSNQLTVNSQQVTTWYRAVVNTTAACTEVISASFQVDVETIDAGVLDSSQEICSGSIPAALQVSDYDGNIVRWESSTDNFNTSVQNISHTDATYQPATLTQTTYYRAVVAGAVCTEIYSEVVEIKVTESPVAGTIAGPAEVCADEQTIEFLLSGYQATIARWEISTDNFTSDIQTINQTSETLVLSGLSASSWVRAVVTNGVCPEVVSSSFAITVLPATEGGTLASDQVVVTDTNSGTLTLSQHAGQVLEWQFSTDNFSTDVQSVNHTATEYTFQNLKTDTWYRVLVKSGDCIGKFSSVVKVTVNHPPSAVDDFYLVEEINYSAPYSVLDNDSDPNQNILQVEPARLPSQQGGTFEVYKDGFFTYEPPAYYFGTDTVVYTVCDGVSGAELCTQALVVFNVSTNGIQVYEGISPNNDGFNDTWTIENIERYPDNTVMLFDRYGTLVYEQKSYRNSDTQFAGVANRGINSRNQLLPDGTYYYKISLGENGQVVQGYLVIKAE
jgi:gliding motility-associated-like protein